MQVGTRLGAGLFLVGVVVVGCSLGSQLAQSTISHPGQSLFNGYANPEVDCYRCHGGDGLGTLRGPDLSKKVPAMSDEAILKVVNEGAFGMPDFGEVLTQEQNQEILAWLRAEFGGGEQEIPSLDVEPLSEETVETSSDAGAASDTEASTN